MVAEVFAGLSAFKAMFDLAKGLKDISDATIRNGAIIELQEQILSAQEAQFELIEQVRDLENQVTDLKAWNAETGSVCPCSEARGTGNRTSALDMYTMLR
jgi:uncharacterized protein YlxW (UPF0749 family)